MSHVRRKAVLPYVNNKGADQPAHPHSLISTFVVCSLDSIIVPLGIPVAQASTGFLVMWLIHAWLLKVSLLLLLCLLQHGRNCFIRGARWLSGRVSDSGARGRGFDTYCRRVVSLSKTLYSPKVLVNYPGSGGSVPT